MPARARDPPEDVANLADLADLADYHGQISRPSTGGLAQFVLEFGFITGNMLARSSTMTREEG